MMVTIFTGLKYCSALIDRDAVRPNVEESLRILSEEGDYKRFVAPLSVSQLDNYTDALMIGEVLAGHPDASAFENMLRSPIYCHDDTISNSLGTYLVVTHQLPDRMFDYYRYWHGYDVTLRPMLTIGDIRIIRVINYILIFGLTIITVGMLYRRSGKYYTLVFLISLLAIGLPLVPMSLQYSSCVFIALTSMALILIVDPDRLRPSAVGLTFLVIGGMTSFLDLLTAPLLTFGMPAVTVLLLRNRFPDYRILLLMGIMWITGYAGIWIFKWVSVAGFIDSDIWREVTDQATTRFGSVTSIGERKIKGLILAGTLLTISVGILLWVYLTIRKEGGEERKKYLSLVVVGLLPFIWMASMQNQTFAHFWYTSRAFGITVWSLGVYALKVYKTKLSKLQLQGNTYGRDE